MSQSSSPVEKSEKPVLDIIQQIKDGKLDPKTLNKEERQPCVEVLLSEGCNVPTMAQILKVHDKTIRRDVADIRLRNSLTPNEEFTKGIAGEIITYARISRDHLMRLARSKDTSVMERAQAEMYSVQVMLNTIARLQSMGFLPEKPQVMIEDVYHHNVLSLEDLQKDLIDVEKVISADSQLKGQVDQFKAIINAVKEKKEETDNGKPNTQSNE